jgi:hypothetical protein
MGATVQPISDLDDPEYAKIKIPRPVPGGSYSVESLGRWVDRLMGDARARREAAARLEPLFMSEDEAVLEPPPVQIPPPVPGASEPVTKGDDPPAEYR